MMEENNIVQSLPLGKVHSQAGTVLMPISRAVNARVHFMYEFQEHFFVWGLNAGLNSYFFSNSPYAVLSKLDI